MNNHFTPISRDFRDYLMRRYDTLARQHRFRGATRDEFQAWQPGARAKLREVLRMPDELGSPELGRQPVDLTGQRWARSRKDPGAAGARERDQRPGEAQASVEELRGLYTLCDAEERLRHDLHEEGHVISGRVAYDWFTEQLAGAPPPSSRGR
jgi:hypothetical protein